MGAISWGNVHAEILFHAEIGRRAVSTLRLRETKWIPSGDQTEVDGCATGAELRRCWKHSRQ